MRELKFRAWDGKNMYDRVLPFTWDFVLNAMAHKCVKSNGVGLLGSGGDYATFEIDGYRFKEIMQFTTRKDKNGKEIYESDICKINYFHLPEDSHVIGIVEWIDTGFSIRGIKNLKGDEITSTYSLNFKSGGNYGDYPAVEVIGNVYQNPELIPTKI